MWSSSSWISAEAGGPSASENRPSALTSLRLLLLVGVAASLWLGSPIRVLAQAAASPQGPTGSSPSPSPSQPSRQVQRCQKLATQVNRLKASRQGPTVADHAYASGIAKLTRRYGYNPCPGLKAPNV